MPTSEPRNDASAPAGEPDACWVIVNDVERGICNTVATYAEVVRLAKLREGASVRYEGRLVSGLLRPGEEVALEPGMRFTAQGELA